MVLRIQAGRKNKIAVKKGAFMDRSGDQIIFNAIQPDMT